MQLIRPVTALRLLSLLVTLLLLAIAFLPRTHFATALLLGGALGLSIGVQAMAWDKRLERAKAEESDA